LAAGVTGPRRAVEGLGNNGSHDGPPRRAVRSFRYSIVSREGFVCHKPAEGRSWQCSVGRCQVTENREREERSADGGQRAEGGMRHQSAASAIPWHGSARRVKMCRARFRR
jgi:hypothetical protein